MASLIRRLRDRSALCASYPRYFLVVVGAAVAVPVPDLGDRGHVDRVIDARLPRSGSVDLAVPGRYLDGAVPL